MDFEPQYTPEQEAFRKEVAAWIDANIPRDLEDPADSADLSREQWEKRREVGKSLGARGWLWPTMSPEYGGGGLDVDHAVIIEEELDSCGLNVPPYYDSGGKMGGPTILVWGTEEQKQRLLPPIFTGQVASWQLLTEPDSGSDLASVKTTAIRDGDDYVVNGQKVFVGSAFLPDQHWTVAVTDPDGERHHNLGWFMIPANLAGITVQRMDLLISGGESGAGGGYKNTVFFDDVRVPASNLIGAENDGWNVAQTHLELEHGTGGRISRNRVIDQLLDHCRNTRRNGQPLSKEPAVRDQLVEVYIEAEISRLFNLRNYWMRHVGKRTTYEGPQSSYFRKMAGLRTGKAILDLLGPYALTYDAEWGPVDGHIEAYERSSLVAVHPGGTADIQKVIMARRIGIGRATREQAGALR